MCGSSFSWFLPLLSVTRAMWLEHFLVKTEAKEVLDTSTFSIAQVTRSPIYFWKGPTISLVYLLLLMFL